MRKNNLVFVVPTELATDLMEKEKRGIFTM
jgi:hypothetical protein